MVQILKWNYVPESEREKEVVQETQTQVIPSETQDIGYTKYTSNPGNTRRNNYYQRLMVLYISIINYISCPRNKTFIKKYIDYYDYYCLIYLPWTPYRLITRFFFYKQHIISNTTLRFQEILSNN